MKTDVPPDGTVPDISRDENLLWQLKLYRNVGFKTEISKFHLFYLEKTQY